MKIPHQCGQHVQTPVKKMLIIHHNFRSIPRTSDCQGYKESFPPKDSKRCTALILVSTYRTERVTSKTRRTCTPVDSTPLLYLNRSKFCLMRCTPSPNLYLSRTTWCPLPSNTRTMDTATKSASLPVEMTLSMIPSELFTNPTITLRSTTPGICINGLILGIPGFPVFIQTLQTIPVPSKIRGIKEYLVHIPALSCLRNLSKTMAMEARIRRCCLNYREGGRTCCIPAEQ